MTEPNMSYTEQIAEVDRKITEALDGCESPKQSAKEGVYLHGLLSKLYDHKDDMTDDERQALQAVARRLMVEAFGVEPE